ncbi:S1C family serine protease [Nocardioides humi]|uniref:PDZ domain-containing protein n=1 Tax=Nocardioides humi TaxID=449461 RepID=A0ABN2BTE7_9ACTN|nr:trypsin-like peptidase domain-containing protein [Nocardioides humi]
MNDVPDPDHEPTEPLEPLEPLDPVEPVHTQWAPPAPGAVPAPGAAPAPDPAPAPAPAPGLASPSGTVPEPTTPLPGLAPSLLPPPPVPPDLTVRMPASHADRSRSRLPGWVIPVVAAVALVVGLGGGLLGALAYDRISEDSPAGPGYSGDGLAGVDLEDSPPLAAPGSVADVAQAVLPSTVQIIAEYGGEAAGASGSGWVMDGDGHIVTNNHVVADAAQNNGPIVVVDHDRNRYDAEVVGRSPIYDLAILYVEDHDGLKPAKLGHSAKLQVGEPVVAIGSPLSLPDTVTSGIVSFLHRPVTTGSSRDSQSWIDAIQTDAAINPGNSGGPLVNQKGEVVGVNSAIATAGGGSIDSEAGNIGVGFAIPVEQVRVTADQILKTGKAQYPLIGAEVKTGGIPGGDGAELSKINSGSPAEKAGLRKGDVITHVNGSRVTDGNALIVAIRTHQPGETIEFTFTRGSDEKKVEVTLDGQEG